MNIYLALKELIQLRVDENGAERSATRNGREEGDIAERGRKGSGRLSLSRMMCRYLVCRIGRKGFVSCLCLRSRRGRGSTLYSPLDG